MGMLMRHREMAVESKPEPKPAKQEPKAEEAPKKKTAKKN